ncbi:MAG: hypothetical protein ABEH43_10565 [Flavobacteriales bacterium]
MKKILIISYFFPPCNLTASQRAHSWAKHLKEFGYEPVVVTRRWDEHVESFSDLSKGTVNEMKKEENGAYEAHYLPYHPNKRDRLYVKHGEERKVFFRKALSFMELLLQNNFNAFVPFSNLYEYAYMLLQKDRNIKGMIATGNPYILFKFAYLLNQKHNIPWIADYRDAWTTSEIDSVGKGKLFRLLRKRDAKFEKKWVGTASYVTASSEPIAKKIEKLTGTKAHPLYNGFDEEVLKTEQKDKYEHFTISYIGMLYPGQNIEIFCEALKKLIDEKDKPAIRLLFPGISFHKEQENRIKEFMKGHEEHFECTERVPRNEILEMEKRSHLLLHVAWKGYSGVIASKIYEYIASGTKIIVTPSDKGAIEQIVKKSGCGDLTNTVEETYEFLNEEYEKYLKGEFDSNDVNREEVLQFSRKRQVGELAGLLDEIL